MKSWTKRKSLTQLHRRKHKDQHYWGAKAETEDELNWTAAVPGCTVPPSLRHRLGPWISAVFSSSSLQRVRQPSVAYTVCVRIIYEQWTHRGPRRKTSSDGVSEVLAGKAGLVTKLLFNPERTWSQLVKVTFCVTETAKVMPAFLEGTHLSSWLYLARRSDRQGAPVLIWERIKTHKSKSVMYKEKPE